MKTIKLTAKDFDSNNQYKGDIDFSNYYDNDFNVEIEANLGWVSFLALRVKGYIQALTGTGIKAGEGIEAGWGIEAGEGIEAGLSIKCKAKLSFKYRLFAGTATFRDMGCEEKEIECGKLEGGTVCYGTVKELGLPEEKDDVTQEAIKLLKSKGFKIVKG